MFSSLIAFTLLLLFFFLVMLLLFFSFLFFVRVMKKVEEWQYVWECMSYLILGTCFILCNLRWFGSYCGLYILKIILVILVWLR